MTRFGTRLDVSKDMVVRNDLIMDFISKQLEFSWKIAERKYGITPDTHFAQLALTKNENEDKHQLVFNFIPKEDA